MQPIHWPTVLAAGGVALALIVLYHLIIARH